MENGDPVTTETTTTTETTPGGEGEGKSTTELLNELVSHQQAQRSEIQQLREELERNRATPARPAPTSQVRSPEDLLRERMEQIEASPYYCPACGKLANYQRECQGTAAAPHPPVEVVSTDELKSGDEAQHTAAPGVAG